MVRNRLVLLAGLIIAASLLLIGGMTAGRPAFAGFTPTSTPTETPTPTSTPTATPVPPPPPPPPTEAPTPTPVPLLPEGGGAAPSPWLFLALGAAALMAGWLVRQKRT